MSLHHATAKTRLQSLKVWLLAVMLGMSVWLTAAAIGNVLQEKWSLGPNEVGWLLTSVQMGFVIGTFTAAVFNLADILPERVYFSFFTRILV